MAKKQTKQRFIVNTNAIKYDRGKVKEARGEYRKAVTARRKASTTLQRARDRLRVLQDRIITAEYGYLEALGLESEAEVELEHWETRLATHKEGVPVPKEKK